MPDRVGAPDIGDAGQQHGGPWPDRAGGLFTDSNKNTFYYDESGNPRYLGLYVNGSPPQPASVPDVKPPTVSGLVPPGPGSGAGSSAMDYPSSYNVGSREYQAAARKGFNDYVNASGSGDSQAMARAERERLANPPDYLKPDNGPQMHGYDPGADEARARRFQDDMLGAVSLPAAWSGGVATMLGKDDATRSRWMEGGAEIASELSPFAAEERGLLGNPAARESLRPVGVPDAIGDKGAAMEGAATLSAHRRGATNIFNGKYGGDHGFDGAYIMRDENGYPQLHVDSVKAKNGRVAVHGDGSMTELGTNNVNTRKKAEEALRINIEGTPIDENFTDRDKRIVLKQLDKGDVVVNLVGLPSTNFHQGHIDFINNETPYTFGSVHTLDPFTPSKAPLLDGAPYGLSSVYLSESAPVSEKP